MIQNGFDVFIFILVPCCAVIGICWAFYEALLDRETERPYDWEIDGA